ncbi:MAG: hypothetical protein IK021_03845, partial [Methanobrevibacter sp.]|nr:hypothetical protein [Methanobrevibacter sp.]
NYIYYFNTEALNDALNATDVFCITGDYTEGAAEWVIRGLTCVLGEDHVFKIGKQTLGQCVLTEDVKSDYYVTLHPAVAFVADKYGDYDYYDGLETDLEINESLYLKLYPYGNENEVLLASVLNEIYNMI